MNELTPQKTMTLSEQLEQERKTLVDKINATEFQQQVLNTQQKWNKKRLKLVEDQIEELKETKA